MAKGRTNGTHLKVSTGWGCSSVSEGDRYARIPGNGVIPSSSNADFTAIARYFLRKARRDLPRKGAGATIEFISNMDGSSISIHVPSRNNKPSIGKVVDSMATRIVAMVDGKGALLRKGDRER